MHFESFEFDLENRKVLDARVGDEVFEGAQVDWHGCGRSDRAWIFEQLDALVERWPGADPDAVRWRLLGSAPEDAPDDSRYALSSANEAGTDWTSAEAWDALDPDTQSALRDHVNKVLTAINGLLLIY